MSVSEITLRVNGQRIKFNCLNDLLGAVKGFTAGKIPFAILVPSSCQELGDSLCDKIDQFGRDQNIRFKVDPSSDVDALKVFLFGSAGAGLGALSGAGAGASIWAGITAAATAYTQASGAMDIVIPGAGTFVSVGLGLGTVSGVAIGGLMAMEYDVKAGWQLPGMLNLEFKPA